MIRPSRRQRHRCRGVALVTTLMILVLVTIVALGVFNLARMERSASASHFNRMQAAEFARMGGESVAAAILKATASADHTWLTTPGLLYRGMDPIDPKGANSFASEEVPLSSGFPDELSPATEYLAPANLNVARFNDPDRRLITDENALASGALSMPLKWIYVRKDGSRDFSETPDTKNTANPIVGRYAYWADDESSKLNLNLAWTRDSSRNPARQGSPTLVSLTALGGMTPDIARDIHNIVTTDSYKTPAQFFNSPEDYSRLEADAFSVLLDKRFSVTHFNHDPDTTFFNEPRIVLTTKFAAANPGLAAEGFTGDEPGIESNPRYRPYLRMLKKENSDPGDYGNIDPAKLNSTMALLKSYLERTDWPLLAGASFQDKYYPTANYPDAAQRAGRLAQLSLHIIDYVRSKEAEASPTWQNIIQPLRGTINPSTGRFTLGTPADANTIVGLARAPVITELGIWLSDDMREMKIITEIYLPPNYGLGDITLAPNKLGNQTSYYFKGQEFPHSARLSPQELSPGPVLKSGGYVVITRTRSLPEGTFDSRPTSLGVRSLLNRATGGQTVDFAPIMRHGMPEVAIAPEGTPESAIRTIEVDDPRVNKHKDDWAPSGDPAGNTLGRRNSRWSVGQPANAGFDPPQDTDADGAVSDYSLRMPPPKGSPGNRYGVVESIGEIGYIHTGVEGAARAGVPWRTFRLQQSNSDKVLPDWALMDLFTVPSEAPDASARQVLAPHDSMVGGRVNLNGANIAPFPDSSRIDPLVGVFLGVTKNGAPLKLAQAQSIAENIRNHDMQVSFPASGTNPRLYHSPGAVIEVNGVADTGESSEDVVRQVANQLTTRGNVFSVYAIGQSLRQTPDGRLVMLAEQRTQSFVERVMNSDGTLFTRKIYQRKLNP